MGRTPRSVAATLAAALALVAAPAARADSPHHIRVVAHTATPPSATHGDGANDDDLAFLDHVADPPATDDAPTASGVTITPSGVTIGRGVTINGVRVTPGTFTVGPATDAARAAQRAIAAAEAAHTAAAGDPSAADPSAQPATPSQLAVVIEEQQREIAALTAARRTVSITPGAGATACDATTTPCAVAIVPSTAHVAAQATDSEHPVAATPTTHEDDPLFGATALYGAQLAPSGAAQTFSFAMRIGGPHYGNPNAGTRDFAVDLGLGYTDAGPWHGTSFDLDIRDFWRFDLRAATYVVLGFAGGDYAHDGRDDAMFTGSLGAGIELSLVPSLCLDAETRVVSHLSSDDSGNMVADVAAQFTAGITVYLGA